MPLYSFNIESPLPSQVALDRIRGLVRDPPAFVAALKESFRWRSHNTPPFIGRVEESGFQIYRDIRYRNSFLPLIRGHLAASPRGTKISVTMNLHPLVTVFMVFWLGVTGLVGITLAVYKGFTPALIPFGMFVFGVALTLGSFFFEALKARRLLEQSLVNDQQGTPADATHAATQNVRRR